MKLSSKLTGGLAWAGLVLILAVPSADMLTRPSANTASVDAAPDATETASIDAVAKPAVPTVKPVVPAVRPVAPAGQAAATAAGGNGAVEKYMASGRKLPSYISDAPVPTQQALAPVATEPLVVPGKPAPAASDEVVDVALVAPEPYPASLRPRSRAATATLPADDTPLVLDEEAVARREATMRAVAPVLDDEPRIIDEEQLQEWDSGSLAEYLERRGLMSESEQADAGSDYDPDGYYLDQGPNRSGARLIRRLRADESGWFRF
ncbi:hypothetical protein [Devosia sp.]|uniref:hypothetical protein n=1 Tax=Devosia sp. TaxID=1871048 RepID=UPI002EE44749